MVKMENWVFFLKIVLNWKYQTFFETNTMSSTTLGTKKKVVVKEEEEEEEEEQENSEERNILKKIYRI